MTFFDRLYRRYRLRRPRPTLRILRLSGCKKESLKVHRQFFSGCPRPHCRAIIFFPTLSNIIVLSPSSVTGIGILK